VVAEAEMQRKIRRTADEKCENARVAAERRCVAGVEGLAVEATRKSSPRKRHPLAYEQMFEKAKVHVERRSVIKLIVEQNFEKARVETKRRSVLQLTVEQRVEKARIDVERRKSCNYPTDE